MQLAGGNVAGLCSTRSSPTLRRHRVAVAAVAALERLGRGCPPNRWWAVFVDLAGKMLAPQRLGQLLRLALARFADRNKSRFGILLNSLVLVTVYFAVSKSAGDPAFMSAIGTLMLPGVPCGRSRRPVGLAYGLGRIFRFDDEDRIALLFVVPEKTLATGVPCSASTLPATPRCSGWRCCRSSIIPSSSSWPASSGAWSGRRRAAAHPRPQRPCSRRFSPAHASASM